MFLRLIDDVFKELVDLFPLKTLFFLQILDILLLTIGSLGLRNLHSQQEEEKAAGEEFQPTLIIVCHFRASKSCQKNSCFQLRLLQETKRYKSERSCECVSNIYVVAKPFRLTSHEQAKP